jgi:hypothetical protein
MGATPTIGQTPQALVEKLNRMLNGWANYFCLGAVSKAYSAVDMHARRRLLRWLCDKHKERRRGYKRFPAVKGEGYWSFAYSALASFRMGMSGSASFQRVRKS